MQPTPLSRWGNNGFSIQTKPRSPRVGASNYFFSTSIKQDPSVSTLKKLQLWLWGMPAPKKSTVGSITWQQQAAYLVGLAFVLGSALTVRHKVKRPASSTAGMPVSVINQPKPVVIKPFDLLKMALSGDAKTAQKALDDIAKHISSKDERHALITLALKHPESTIAGNTITKIASLIPTTESAMRQELYMLGVQHHDSAVSRQAATEMAKNFSSPNELLKFVQALPVKNQLSFTSHLEAKEQYLVIEKGLKDQDEIARCRAIQQIEKLNLLNQNAIQNQLIHLAANEKNPAVATALLESIDKISFSAQAPTRAEIRALNTFKDNLINSAFQNKQVTPTMVKACTKAQNRIRAIVDTDFKNQPVALKEIAAKYFTALPASEKTLARWDIVRDQRAQWGDPHIDTVKEELSTRAAEVFKKIDDSYAALDKQILNTFPLPRPNIVIDQLSNINATLQDELRKLMASDPIRELKPSISIGTSITLLDDYLLPIFEFKPSSGSRALEESQKQYRHYLSAYLYKGQCAQLMLDKTGKIGDFLNTEYYRDFTFYFPNNH